MECIILSDVVSIDLLTKTSFADFLSCCEILHFDSGYFKEPLLTVLQALSSHPNCVGFLPFLYEGIWYPHLLRGGEGLSLVGDPITTSSPSIKALSRHKNSQKTIGKTIAYC